MPARYMLDTDICIFLRSGRSKAVGERIASLDMGEAIISVVSYGELRLGAEKSRRREHDVAILEALLRAFSIEPLPVEAAAEYGAIRADLERRGELIGANDLWIAAHARSAGLTLVTNNEREFRRVPGLAVENWAAAA